MSKQKKNAKKIICKFVLVWQIYINWNKFRH